MTALQIPLSVKRELTRWFIFGVIVSVLPVLANGAVHLLYGVPLTWGGVLGNGELLITSACLAATSAGELFGYSKGQGLREMWSLGGCVLVGLISIFLFGVVSAGGMFDSTQHHVEETVVTISSLIAFIVTLPVGGACVWFAALERR